jgi:peptidoglycan L-alanyl-D-glutamate endopeptidase CwlK
MASRSLDDLEPGTRARAERFLAACADAGLDILIYCTHRSHAEQDALYSKGRSQPGPIVTNARGGQSWHNWRRAFDFVPMIGGKPQWNDRELYRRAGIIAEQCDLEWAGRWNGTLRETAHCQYRGGVTLAQLQAQGDTA